MEAVNGDTDKNTLTLKSEDNKTECCVLTDRVLTDHVAKMQVSDSERLRCADRFQAHDEYSNICPCFQLLIL